MGDKVVLTCDQRSMIACDQRGEREVLRFLLEMKERKNECLKSLKVNWKI